MALKTAAKRMLALVWLLLAAATARASDHADPIFSLREESGLTDLFVFPVGEDGKVVLEFQREQCLPLHNPYADIIRKPLTDDERKQIKALVFILCIRPGLTDSTRLWLTPYTYSIHIDFEGRPRIDLYDPDAPEYECGDDLKTVPHGERISEIEAYARYGGLVPEPEGIEEDATMEFRLENNGILQEGYPKFSLPRAETWNNNLDIQCESGVFDDPFIFPMFYGTNTVAIITKIPIKYFGDDTDLLVWANSRKGKKQIDHVGRSLRTQNPRFEFLNKLHPSEHVAALDRERHHPSLLRDLALKANLTSLFAFREWDFEPDVMVYSTRYPAGFPNGRVLDDDVAAILAQHGDVVLYELSHQGEKYTWPRQTVNDRGTFRDRTFPYLYDPFPDRAQPPGHQLSWWNKLLLLLIVTVVGLLIVFSYWLVARWYHRRKLRRRYL